MLREANFLIPLGGLATRQRVRTSKGEGGQQRGKKTAQAVEKVKTLKELGGVKKRKKGEMVGGLGSAKQAEVVRQPLPHGSAAFDDVVCIFEALPLK